MDAEQKKLPLPFDMFFCFFPAVSLTILLTKQTRWGVTDLVNDDPTMKQVVLGYCYVLGKRRKIIKTNTCLEKRIKVIYYSKTIECRQGNLLPTR